jgi:hypothetical protein
MYALPPTAGMNNQQSLPAFQGVILTKFSLKNLERRYLSALCITCRVSALKATPSQSDGSFWTPSYVDLIEMAR